MRAISYHRVSAVNRGFEPGGANVAEGGPELVSKNSYTVRYSKKKKQKIVVG